MPNVMMVGFTSDEYERAKEIIDAAMQSLELGNDAVTTWFPRWDMISKSGCLVTSCDGRRTNMPYIVVRSTSGMTEINKIVEALNKYGIGVDCEKQPLPADGFIEAKNMRS